MFDATLKDREQSFDSAPGTTMFLHWLVGMVYVFYFASFILLLREVSGLLRTVTWKTLKQCFLKKLEISLMLCAGAPARCAVVLEEPERSRL